MSKTKILIHVLLFNLDSDFRNLGNLTLVVSLQYVLLASNDVQ